jgi:hypothetical protein
VAIEGYLKFELVVSRKIPFFRFRLLQLKKLAISPLRPLLPIEDVKQSQWYLRNHSLFLE